MTCSINLCIFSSTKTNLLSSLIFIILLLSSSLSVLPFTKVSNSFSFFPNQTPCANITVPQVSSHNLFFQLSTFSSTSLSSNSLLSVYSYSSNNGKKFVSNHSISHLCSKLNCFASDVVIIANFPNISPQIFEFCYIEYPPFSVNLSYSFHSTSFFVLNILLFLIIILINLFLLFKDLVNSYKSSTSIAQKMIVISPVLISFCVGLTLFSLFFIKIYNIVNSVVIVCSFYYFYLVYSFISPKFYSKILKFWMNICFCVAFISHFSFFLTKFVLKFSSVPLILQYFVLFSNILLFIFISIPIVSKISSLLVPISEKLDDRSSIFRHQSLFLVVFVLFVYFFVSLLLNFIEIYNYINLFQFAIVFSTLFLILFVLYFPVQVDSSFDNFATNISFENFKI
ncbi:hypothetical protein RCL1_007607 [Eukaryota sp. TZLM3-RCL]